MIRCATEQEYLAQETVNAKHRNDDVKHSQLHSIRESWESALVGKSLLAAEAAADFYMCRIAQPPRKALEAPAARVKAKFGSLLDAERESHQISEALLPR
ncbi:hypothetical protein ETB97_011953 [Aspergillus alliaceus]|uniref:Uncharacterized protein n=1 Tax=Petromyces alliaceus TaxID=209559 RepID=A0A8H6EC25_PETAA|nr:hypothetical protein ETB97_011953 [Aspergillus burnettii]